MLRVLYTFAARSRTMTILAVDPDKIDRLIIKKTLASRYNITTLSSSREAEAFVKTNHVDVALINTKLIYPLDCINLYKHLTQINQALHGIAMASYVDDQKRQLLLAAGFGGILMKPFTLVDFQLMVQRKLVAVT